MFVTCTTLSAKTDLLVFVNLIFGKSSSNVFLVIFPREYLSPDAGHSVHSSVLMVGIDCPHAQYQKNVHSWQQNWQWIDAWKVYTDSPRVSSWNWTRPIFVATHWCLLLVYYDIYSKKHILSSWWALQYSSLTRHFSYVFAERIGLLFEWFV